MSAMNEKERTLERTAQRALEGAGQRGIKDVRISVYRGRNVSVAYRKGRAEKVEESTSRSLSLSLYLDGRYTSCSTNDLRPDALDRFLDSAAALCKAMQPDEFRRITDPALYEGRREIDLEIFDPAVDAVTPDERHARASELEQATLELAGKDAVSVESAYQDESGEVYQLHSNGFEGRKRGSQFWTQTEVALQDEGDKRPSGWAVAGARKKADLPAARELGARTVELARARMGATKRASEQMVMVVENRTTGRVLGRLLSALSGRALQQKATFLEGREGQPFGSVHLDLVDDPFVAGGFGSRLFDGEGIAAKPMPLFEKGVLRNFYIDTYYGLKLGRTPTTGARSNVLLTPGERSLEELIEGVDKGVLVRGFIGGNSNTTTGDFSMGVYGTLIEKGVLGAAVAEMNIGGNHEEFWKKLAAVGNDPYPYSSLRSPSLLFEDVQFSGL